MDGATIRHARDGDPRALRALGSWLHLELLAFFTKGKFKHTDRVNDLIQETVSDVLKKLADDAPDDPDKFRGWVHSFGGTEILTIEREREREHARADLCPRGNTPAISASASVLAPLIDEQQRQLLRQHAQQLPTVYRNAILHVLDGGDYRSLAASEGIPEGTASSRLSYATERVRRSIEAARRTPPKYRTRPPARE